MVDVSNSNDVNSAATFGTLNNGTTYYMVEFERPLVTNNPNEMQINQNGTYGLSFGLFDDAKHEDHAISETYNLTFDNVIASPSTNTTTTTSSTNTNTKTNSNSSNPQGSSIEGFNLGYLIPISITFLIVLDVSIRKKITSKKVMKK